jgi:AcrR family transcriptional regulator
MTGSRLESAGESRHMKRSPSPLAAPAEEPTRPPHDGDDAPDAEGRPMRADARRNYDSLVTAARKVFADNPSGASMEAIAKQAGVGVGTLYRHFPRRIDLIEAVYREDVSQLVDVADSVTGLEPWPAMAAYLEAFVVYLRRKRIFLNELHEAFEKNPDLRVRSRELIESSMGRVLARAQEDGSARADIDGSDLMQLIGPMCMSATLSEDQSTRLVAMILDGLRAPADAHA